MLNFSDYKVRSKYSQQINAGYNANILGDALDKNPHTPETPPHAAWDWGWKSADMFVPSPATIAAGGRWVSQFVWHPLEGQGSECAPVSARGAA